MCFLFSTCADRFSFYNDMGVIRDVFQNHLTQLLTLVALDLPANLTASAIEQAKVRSAKLPLWIYLPTHVQMIHIFLLTQREKLCHSR
jgi:hypothetical protein